MRYVALDKRRNTDICESSNESLCTINPLNHECPNSGLPGWVTRLAVTFVKYIRAIKVTQQSRRLGSKD